MRPGFVPARGLRAGTKTVVLPVLVDLSNLYVYEMYDLYFFSGLYDFWYLSKLFIVLSLLFVLCAWTCIDFPHYVYQFQ